MVDGKSIYSCVRLRFTTGHCSPQSVNAVIFYMTVENVDIIVKTDR